MSVLDTTPLTTTSANCSLFMFECIYNVHEASASVSISAFDLPYCMTGSIDLDINGSLNFKMWNGEFFVNSSTNKVALKYGYTVWIFYSGINISPNLLSVILLMLELSCHSLLLFCTRKMWWPEETWNICAYNDFFFTSGNILHMESLFAIWMVWCVCPVVELCKTKSA